MLRHAFRDRVREARDTPGAYERALDAGFRVLPNDFEGGTHGTSLQGLDGREYLEDLYGYPDEAARLPADPDALLP